MKVHIEIDEATLRKLILEYLRNSLGAINIKPELIVIQVKSKQNFKSEWEYAAFRAVYDTIDL